MKSKIMYFFVGLILIGQQCFSQDVNTKDAEKDKILIYLLNGILAQGHYVKKDIDNNFSEFVYNQFIETLDPSKRYFTEEDLKEFSQYKFDIDDQIKATKVDFYNLVYKRYLEKIKFAKTTYKTILLTSFDYNKNENINLKYDSIPFAQNDQDLIKRWKKTLKLNVISKIQELQKEDQEKLKKDTKHKIKDFYTLEHEARKAVLDDTNELYTRIDELKHNDWFSSYLNVIVSGFDPHTTYMSPRIKSRFEQNMSGKLEGIGARLVKKGIYTEIVELISGGPAWKQGELEPGDKILKVAQGSKDPIDIVGMRLDDAIQFIKGKKGTEVRLTVRKKIDGSTKVIPIIRDIVELEETFVKSSIVTKDGKRYGIINLPKFYIDFKDKNSRTAATDMKLEIERLKKENVDGLIVDLRNNGGGSLKTVVEIGGLFIDKGPIVQVKYRGQRATIKSDTDPKIQWDGSLVVLVNEFSASASEILAAAIQDYGRGVIMGSTQTYGKGTEQNVLPLNYYFKKYPGDLGSLKMTIQKFYRINGGSTQIEGVYSDIKMPSKYSYMKYGERDLIKPLKWDKVKQASFKKTKYYTNFDKVVKESTLRINKNMKFKSIESYAKWIKENQDDYTFSLNYKTYTSENKIQEIQAKSFKEVLKYKSDLNFKSPKYEVALFKNDSVLKEKRDRWHKSLKEDIYMNEALNVLSKLKLNKQEI